MNDEEPILVPSQACKDVVASSICSEYDKLMHNAEQHMLITNLAYQVAMHCQPNLIADKILGGSIWIVGFDDCAHYLFPVLRLHLVRSDWKRTDRTHLLPPHPLTPANRCAHSSRSSSVILRNSTSGTAKA